MNYIDKSFYGLTAYLSKLTEEEIFENIKYSYLNVSDEIKNGIEDFFKKFNYWGTLDYKRNDYEELRRRANSIHNHLEDFRWLYEKLEDYRSKKLLYAILSNWYRYDFKELKECYETQYPDYFDLDIVKCDEKEVLVDLGVYTGDTILDYLRLYDDKYKRIYCYEITDESFNQLKDNLSRYRDIVLCKKAVIDVESTMYIKENEFGSPDANNIASEGSKEINVVTIDNDIKEKITMIKMDIEGIEYKALLGCKKHIEEDAPKLLISVYHNHEDIWRIPRLIDSIKPGYKFWLRYHGNNIFPTEVTLIAIYED